MAKALCKVLLLGSVAVGVVVISRVIYDLVDSDMVWHPIEDRS